MWCRQSLKLLCSRNFCGSIQRGQIWSFQGVQRVRHHWHNRPSYRHMISEGPALAMVQDEVENTTQMIRVHAAQV